MVIAFTPSTHDEENLRLEVNISTTLGITAGQAKRKLTRYLMDHLSLFITPATPLLVVVNTEKILWRFPLVLAMGHRGQLGRVGEVDVDAHSGEILLDDTLLEEIKANAQRLAKGAALPAVN
jgi:hypothetical protein